MLSRPNLCSNNTRHTASNFRSNRTVVRTVDGILQPAKGLPGDAEVTVVSYDLKTYNYVVRDAAGGEWAIQALQNLDAGSEYMLGGRWLQADHPLVLAELRIMRTNS